MTCPACQTPNPEGAKFCLNCGTKFAAPSALEGERKLVTLLFADVVDSTALAARLDPEAWAEVMNGAFAFMNAAVTRYGGTVGRLMGDAVLAFFGAPVAHEDDAERAVRAALELLGDAVGYGRQLQGTHGLAFHVRVGINTGLSVLATVGDQAKAEYTAMGDTANLAARLQSLAAPDTVLIGADTYRLVERLFEARPLEVAVKGRAEPVSAYEVLGPKARPGRVRGLTGLSSPLVGREGEFALLEARLKALRGGQGGLVSVVGEAGLGKSRLVAELRRAAQGRELRWLEGRALSYAQSVLYYPWRQVVLASLGAREADAPEAVRERLRHQASSRYGLPGGDLPFLETVLAVESEASLRRLTEVEGEALVARITEAVQGYVRALARLEPTVLAFDDLHWADDASLELLLAVAEVTREVPLLLLCVLRPDKQAKSWPALERARAVLGTRCTRLVLEPLGSGEAQTLLENLLEVENLPAEVRGLILDKAEGNPFFLEEVIRALIDAGHLVQEQGRWRAGAEIASVAIPDTLTGVLGARIDRLEAAPKRVAQTAAVIGRSFAERVLAEVIGAAPDEERVEDLPTHLFTLTAEELLRERAREPELEYAFKHALTQEAAYERLLIRRRKALHRRTGEVLERLYGPRREELAPVLAHHFAQGEAWPQAAHYAKRAALRAAKLYALAEAQALYDKALEALEQVPETPAGELIDLLLGWAQMAVLRRQQEQPQKRQKILARLERALTLARGLGDQRRLAQALVAKGNALALSGFPAEGFTPLTEAFDLARALGDEHLVLLPYWAATEMMLSRDPRGAAAQFEEVVELARKVKNKGIEAHALGSKAMAHARLGEAEAARAAIERALAVVTESGSTIKQADVNIAAGATYFDLGEWERGLRHSVKGAQLAESVQGLQCACAGYYTSGVGKLEAAQVEAAILDLDQALHLGSDAHMEGYLPQVHATRAIADVAAGDAQAMARVEAALGTVRQVGDDYAVGFTLLALGDAKRQLGQREAAEAHLREALALYRAKGMRPYAARTLRLLAEVHAAAGRAAEAEHARAEASALERASPGPKAAP